MDELKAVGAFRELEGFGAPTLQSLVSSCGQLSPDEAAAVVKHLSLGVPVLDVMESVLDPIDKKTRLSGGSSLESDGVWVWRNDLKYFVQKYRVGLPPEFIQYVIRVDGQIAIDEARIASRWREASAAFESLARNSPR